MAFIHILDEHFASVDHDVRPVHEAGLIGEGEFDGVGDFSRLAHSADVHHGVQAFLDLFQAAN